MKSLYSLSKYISISIFTTKYGKMKSDMYILYQNNEHSASKSSAAL